MYIVRMVISIGSLPQKRICGRRQYVFQLTDDKYKELAVYADDLDDSSDDDEPVLMRVDE